MEDLLQASLPWLLVSLTAVVLLMLVPLSSEKGRGAIAGLLGAGAVAAGFTAALQGGEPRSLDVVNPFPQGPDGEMQVMVFEVVTAPGWQWAIALAVMLALAAILVVITKSRSTPPNLVIHPVAVSAWLLVTRLVLEKTAAPGGLVWATGLSMAIVPTVLILGLYGGRRHLSYGRFALGIVGFALAQRALVTAVSWFVTARNLGTHLDMAPLTHMNSRFADPMTFETPMEAWRSGVLFAQMVMWAPMVIIAGLLLGGLTWALTRKSGGSS